MLIEEKVEEKSPKLPHKSNEIFDEKMSGYKSVSAFTKYNSQPYDACWIDV